MSGAAVGGADGSRCGYFGFEIPTSGMIDTMVCAVRHRVSCPRLFHALPKCNTMIQIVI